MSDLTDLNHVRFNWAHYFLIFPMSFYQSPAKKSLQADWALLLIFLSKLSFQQCPLIQYTIFLLSLVSAHFLFWFLFILLSKLSFQQCPLIQYTVFLLFGFWNKVIKFCCTGALRNISWRTKARLLCRKLRNFCARLTKHQHDII